MQHVGIFACEDCGEVVLRRKRADKANVCLNCGIARVAANAKRYHAMAQERRERKQADAVRAGG